MKSIVKISISLLITVVLFSGFTFFSFSGLFDYIESRFYNERIKTAEKQEVDRALEKIREFHDTNRTRFGTLLGEESVRAVYLPNSSREEITGIQHLFNKLKDEFSGFLGARFVDKNGFIDYSTFEDDIEQADDFRREYKRLVETEGPDAMRLLLLETDDEDVYIEGSQERLLYRFKSYNKIEQFQGTALFYVSIRDLKKFLIRDGVLELGKSFTPIDNLGFLLNLEMPQDEEFSSDIEARIKELWTNDQGVETFERLAQSEFGSAYLLYSVFSDEAGFIGSAFSESELSLSLTLKILLLASFFLTTYLLIFLVLSLRQDRVLVLKDRIKRFQITFLREYVENKEKIDWDIWRRELQSRKSELQKNIRKGLGSLKGEKNKEVDELFEKSWADIIDVIGRRIESKQAPQLEIQNLEEIIKRVITDRSVIQTAADAQSASTAAEAVVRVDAAEDKRRKKPLPDEIEELEEAEEVEELEEVEEVEEVEAAEGSEEAEEAIEELEEAEAVEELEEVEEAEEAEAVEGVEEAEEAVEELEEAEEVEELEEVEEVEEVEAAEGAEEAEEAVEELAEAEAVEELEEIEEAEEAEEAEAVEGAEEAEEEVEELEEAEEVEELEEVEEVEEVEAAEGAEEAEEEVEELEEAEEVEELEEVEEVEEVEAAEGVEEAADETGAALSDIEQLPEIEYVEAAYELISEEEYLTRLAENEATEKISETSEADKAVRSNEVSGRIVEELPTLPQKDAAAVEDEEIPEEIESFDETPVVSKESLVEIGDIGVEEKADNEQLDIEPLVDEQSVDEEPEDLYIDELEEVEPLNEEALISSSIEAREYGSGKRRGRDEDQYIFIERLPDEYVEDLDELEIVAREESHESMLEVITSDFSLYNDNSLPYFNSYTFLSADIAELTDTAPEIVDYDSSIPLVKSRPDKEESKETLPVEDSFSVLLSSLAENGKIEIHELSELQSYLEGNTEAVDFEDGVYTVKEDILKTSHAGKDKDKKFIDLVESVVSEPKEDGVGSIEDLIASYIDDIEIEFDEESDGGVESSSVHISHDQILVGEGINYDFFIERIQGGSMSEFKSLMKISRRLDALSCGFLVENEKRLELSMSIGLHDAITQKFSLDRKSPLYKHIFSNQRILYVKGPESGIELLDKNIGLIDKKYLKASLYVPIRFQDQHAYLFLGFKSNDNEFSELLSNILEEIDQS